MNEPSAAIQLLLDREAIRDVLRRYAHAVDRRQLDTIRALFTADASYQGSLGSGDIETVLAQLRQRMRGFESTMHLLGNQLIEVDGDRATSETYAIAYHRLIEGVRRNMAVGVRYCDELIRSDGSWKIRKRVVHLEWQRYDELVMG